MKDLVYKHAFLELAAAPDQDSLAILEEFREIVRSAGCSMHIMDSKDGRQTLCLTINCETAKNSRNAGRRKKLVTRDHWRITCGEVRKMIDEKGSEAAAEELGVSRATLFRRLKDKDDTRRF